MAVEMRKAQVTQGGKFLTFELAGVDYGLEILKMQEIIGMMNVTHVPRTPDYVRDVINLRSKVGNKVILLLDVDRVLSRGELEEVGSVKDIT